MFYNTSMLSIIFLVVSMAVNYSQNIEVISECKRCESLRLNDGGDVITNDHELYHKHRLDQGAFSMSAIEHRDAILSPTIIVIPMTENEIIEIINYAKDCDYTISIRSGGHQYSGLSSCDGSKNKCIQIDMRYFDYIHYNKDNKDTDIDNIKSITVASGVKLADLYEQNNLNDIAIIGGICASVAAGGHYQSSAQSVWSRSLGLGLDYIIGIKIITANGKIKYLHKNTQNKNDKDLFWAILGGSPGSWGVVIEYEFVPINNSDYPYSSYYQYTHFYTKKGFGLFFTEFINLLNNPYYYNNNDISIFYGGQPMLSDNTTSSSLIGHIMSMNLMWTGIDNNNIHSIIPNHPMNKTWHQELIQPFINIDIFLHDHYSTDIKELRHEGPTSISGYLFEKAQTVYSVIPPFRTLNFQCEYNKTTFYELLNNKLLTKQWIQSITNKFDELAGTKRNITTNIAVLWQFWDLFRNEGKLNDDIYINYNALENDVSYPLRSMRLQCDNVVLFGDGEIYSDDIILKAKQYQYELKQILNENEIKSDLKSYAYTDLMANQYDLNKQFNQFYDYKPSIYNKLKNIKTRVDAKNIFKGPLTIPPKSNKGKSSQIKTN